MLMLLGIPNALDLKYFTEFPVAIRVVEDFHRKQARK